MKAAVIGLGVEGRKAVKSLRKRGYKVYATDINTNLNLEGLEDVEVDLGFHDMEKIKACDIVTLSPSLYNTPLKEEIEDKLICNIIGDYKDTYTIGVTGTNGKTTTALMITKILEKWGKKVLVGGNAGGGFQGYTELILQATEKKYDIIVVEICDMTLDFADQCFNLDLVILTNIGRDHMNHHKTIKNYKESLRRFLKDKRALLNREDPLSLQLKTPKSILYGPYDGQIRLFGEFNKLNAGAAAKATQLLGTPKSIIDSVLGEFEAPRGRIQTYKFNKANIIIGKIDNPSAMKTILQETLFDIIFLGTPRRNENWRFETLQEIGKKPPRILVLFPGLEDTTDIALKCAKELPSKVLIVKDTDELIKLLEDFSREYNRILIGGNGQEKIIKIQENIEKMVGQ
ncbi:UDP-N-acetylmuramyl peptide synthase [Methanothermobacter tenebrarum]|jgi:UDP-N-acetylmuramoylalanine--D-glutamate ligase|uniref:UDP-N-acetylmuramyl peptide synthase n=1 Tax=Methanothermobacter tenebrarum TaxID=680118 RepID=A0ABM7YDY4_9EURY|nr:Mur ligase family protein [Methanothermobacter tenebrarum]MDD3455086.1 Mur ligase family protein [Methanobacteriales archaeon]MDX9694031.1 Mur ligase family protein [Methanothermobacter sp.]BDH79598.1 UDP-N-acetylmuramyl peptide synthase [Methanothermobacter tenebrarum]